MASPFYRIYVEGEEITKYVTRFEYQDCIEKDDLINISLGNVPLSLIDNEKIAAGAFIQCQWGYLGGKTRTVTGNLDNDEPNYGTDGISLTLKSLDKGQQMKKSEKDTVWKNVTATQIIRQIAEKYSLKYVGGESTKVYENLPQGNRTDWEFLEYIAQLDSGGNVIFYVKGNELRAKKRDLGQASKRTYTRGAPNSGWISFKPKHEETEQTGAAGETKTVGYDMMNKAPIEGTANADTDTNTKLGGNVPRYDENATEIGKSYATGKKIVSPVTDKTEADNIAAKQRLDMQLKNITADFTTVGDPDIAADEIITINGVARKHQGNYYVKEAKHTITGDTYICSQKLSKDGTAVPTSGNSSKTDNVNKNSGPDEKQVKKTVPRYNENGEEIKPFSTGTSGSW